MSYTLKVAGSVADLEAVVEEAMAEGYNALGGPMVAVQGQTVIFYQALTKPGPTIAQEAVVAEKGEAVEAEVHPSTSSGPRTRRR